MESCEQKSRYVILDSYRALAALLVVAFHYFYRWSPAANTSDLLPDVPFLSDSAFVAHGFLGVEFFFIISGFVIALTLQSTSSLLDFAKKRFARLFPAMLVCSVITYTVVSVLDVRPLSDVNPSDFLPSWTFVSPYFYNKLFGLNTDWVDGVYWSLFVEVKFYVFASVIYFFSPRRFLLNYLLFSVALCLVFWTSQVFGVDKVSNLLTHVFYAQYAGFFLAGIAFQRMFQSGGEFETHSVIVAAVGVAYSLLLYSLYPAVAMLNDGWYASSLLTLFFALFFIFVIDSPLTKIFESKWLAKIGVASYSLYLLHQNVGISLLYKINLSLGSSPLWTLLVIALMIAISIFLYNYVETPARSVIRQASTRVIPRSVFRDENVTERAPRNVASHEVKV